MCADHHSRNDFTRYRHRWEMPLIWVSAVLTVWSMVYYLQKALPEIRARVK